MCEFDRSWIGKLTLLDLLVSGHCVVDGIIDDFAMFLTVMALEVEGDFALSGFSGSMLSSPG